MSIDYSDMAFPKPVFKKKRKKSKPPILDTERNICFLCAHLKGDIRRKRTEAHHIIFGGGRRKISEEEGLKVWLCLLHHRFGPEAVHNNQEMRKLLCNLAQKRFEETHTREEWMQLVEENYI